MQKLFLFQKFPISVKSIKLQSFLTSIIYTLLYWKIERLYGIWRWQSRYQLLSLYRYRNLYMYIPFFTYACEILHHNPASYTHRGCANGYCYSVSHSENMISLFSCHQNYCRRFKKFRRKEGELNFYGNVNSELKHLNIAWCTVHTKEVVQAIDIHDDLFNLKFIVLILRFSRIIDLGSFSIDNIYVGLSNVVNK